MNSKSVYGLDNDLDGDAETLLKEDSNISNPVPSPLNDIEIIYESNNIKLNDQHMKTWKKYIPADLKQPVTPNLIHFGDNEKLGPSSGKRKHDEETNDTLKHTNKMLPTSRRRPTLHVKALTRSELAEKYDKLLDKRLDLVEYQKKKIVEELSAIEGERKLKFQLLELQIEVEKEKLRQLRNFT